MPGLCRGARAADVGVGIVKLLFDQNLSRKLVARLANLFPVSSRARTAGLGSVLKLRCCEYGQH